MDKTDSPQNFVSFLARHRVLAAALAVGATGLSVTSVYFYRHAHSETQRIQSLEREPPNKQVTSELLRKDLETRDYVLEREQQDKAQLYEDRRDSHRALIREQHELNKYKALYDANKAELSDEKARRTMFFDQMMATRQKMDVQLEQTDQLRKTYAELQEQLKSTQSVLKHSHTNPTTTTLGLYWNAWTEEYSNNTTSFDPILTLKPDGAEYSVIVNLSALSYDTRSGTSSTNIGRSTRDWLEEPGSDATLDILLFRDDKFIYQDPGEELQKMTVHKKDLKTPRSSVDSTGPVWNRLKRHEVPVFGEARFHISTTKKAGRTKLTFAIWTRDGIPIDEFHLDLCVSKKPTESCKGPSALPATSFEGIDALRLNSSSISVYPDGALHFIEFGSSGIIGIFRCNNCKSSEKEYYSWKLGHNAEWLTQYLNKTVLDDFEQSQDFPDIYRRHGEDLFNTLFQGKDKDQSGKAAFLDFIKNSIRDNSKPGPEPSVFVRLLPRQSDSLILFPLGLMVVPIDDAKQKDFLGFHFRIETPLERQDYSLPEECISHWHLLVPGKNPNSTDELQTARSQVEGWIDTFTSVPDAAKVCETIDCFRQWINPDTDLDNSAPTRETIVILSHHDANRIFLEKNNPADSLESASVQRELGKSSVAILSACGTGKPAAMEFVRQFNDRGVAAAISTSTSVPAAMGGAYLECLLRRLSQKHPAQKIYTLFDANFDAIHDLSEMVDPSTNQKWGAKALIFTVVGNGALRICTPKVDTD